MDLMAACPDASNPPRALLDSPPRRLFNGRVSRSGARIDRELPSFDPKDSIRFAHELLTEAGVEFALIGKLAMWVYLPSRAHTITKDADFAVPRSATRRIAARLAARGIRPRPLSIGGLGVRHGDVRVDFIDRREGGLAPLYEEAVRKARGRRAVGRAGGVRVAVVPVEYLVAMKVVAAEEKDQNDAVELLKTLPRIDLALARDILRRHGGSVAVNLLDALARRAGRPDARPEYRNSG
jgi:hypothetical protein